MDKAKIQVDYHVVWGKYGVFKTIFIPATKVVTIGDVFEYIYEKSKDRPNLMKLEILEIKKPENGNNK